MKIKTCAILSYPIVHRAENVIDFSNLRFAFQVDWSVEKWNFVTSTFTHQISFARMNKVS